MSGESPITVFSGHALSADEGNLVAGNELTRLILLAGPVRSGKTTLLNAMYEAVRRSPIDGFLFAGSMTLLGYEERCHLSRAASELDEPDTLRTEGATPEKLLHLRVRSTEGGQQVLNLLMCDDTGEVSEAANNSEAELRRMPFLANADRIVLLINGEALISATDRHKAKHDSLTFIRACCETGILDSTSVLDVVFSKQDKVLAHDSREVVLAFQAGIEKDISRRYGKEIGSLHYYRVAARPTLNEAAVELLKAWLTDQSRQSTPTMPLDPADLQREIDRFAYKDKPRKPK